MYAANDKAQDAVSFCILGWDGGIQGFFFSCSQCVPIIFTRGSHPVPKGLPKFPTCSQQHLNSIPHKPAFPCTQTEKLGSTFDSISRLGVQRDVSIGECPMFQNIGDGSINLAPSKSILPFVSACHYLLQFIEPLIRMVHHGIDKDRRQLIDRVHTFRPPPLASLVRHLGHLTINPSSALLHSNCRAHRTLLLTLLSLLSLPIRPLRPTLVLLAQLFSAYLGSRVFTNFAQFAAVSPTSIRQHNGWEIFSSCSSCHSGTFCVAASSPPHDGHCIRCGPRTRLLCRRSQEPHHR